MSFNDDSSNLPAHSLKWRLHLAKQQPYRLIGIASVSLTAAICVWAMYHSILPVVTAIGLLIASASEFLFPSYYSVTSEGVFVRTASGRWELKWSSARRLGVADDSLLITPLAVPSRLDAFRGVKIRFAAPGQKGDKQSVLSLVSEYAPALLDSLGGRAARPPLTQGDSA